MSLRSLTDTKQCSRFLLLTRYGTGTHRQSALTAIQADSQDTEDKTEDVPVCTARRACEMCSQWHSQDDTPQTDEAAAATETAGDAGLADAVDVEVTSPPDTVVEDSTETVVRA